MFPTSNGIGQLQVPPCFDVDLEPESYVLPREIGQEVELGCPVEGFPTPDIVWLKDGQEVQANQNFSDPERDIIISVLTKNREYPTTKFGFLTITKMEESDIGTYRCLATNNLTEFHSDTSPNIHLVKACRLCSHALTLERKIVWQVKNGKLFNMLVPKMFS